MLATSTTKVEAVNNVDIKKHYCAKGFGELFVALPDLIIEE